MANNMRYIGGWNVAELVREVAQLRTATNLLRLEIENRLERALNEIIELKEELKQLLEKQ